MIRNIVFAGCSYTWGQSLHFFQYGDKSDNIHPLDGQYYACLLYTPDAADE